LSSIDFGRAAGDYSRHRVGFPPEFFARVAPWGAGVAGQELLDIGTGTGTLARGFALRGCRVTGLDPSSEMLAQAQESDRATGIEIAYVQANAENTGLPDGSFDGYHCGVRWLKRLRHS
jgi:ubiquinone/menaquinone biosynthesis C-methylase UbiE